MDRKVAVVFYIFPIHRASIGPMIFRDRGKRTEFCNFIEET